MLCTHHLMFSRKITAIENLQNSPWSISHLVCHLSSRELSGQRDAVYKENEHWFIQIDQNQSQLPFEVSCGGEPGANVHREARRYWWQEVVQQRNLQILSQWPRHSPLWPAHAHHPKRSRIADSNWKQFSNWPLQHHTWPNHPHHIYFKVSKLYPKNSGIDARSKWHMQGTPNWATKSNRNASAPVVIRVKRLQWPLEFD